MKVILLSLCLVAGIYSCSNLDNIKVTGTWIPQKNNQPVKEQIVITQDNTMFIQSTLSDTPRLEKTLHYSLTPDHKHFTMQEGNGPLNEFDVVELSNTDFKLKSLSSQDTLIMKRKK